MKNGLWACLAGCWLLPLASAQGVAAPVELADLTQLLEPIRERHAVPALGAAVIVDGKLHALGVTGVRKYGSEPKVTVDDLWHIGSCTKAMTATLLARQVEAGKLRWSMTLGEALPDLRDKMHADARAVTIQQLLQHRAGLPSQPPMPLWLELFHFEGSDREARAEVAEAMLKGPLEAVAGERFLYSNAGYMIAGAIAERTAKLDWQQLIRRDLFEPLGMQSAGFGPPGDEQLADQPWGHGPIRKAPKPLFKDNPSALGPAGTVHCSLRDWAKFIALHLGVEPANGEALLQPATLQALHTPAKGGEYALGWIQVRRGWAPGPILVHNGSNTMWFCVTWLSPETKFAVLVTCNQGGSAKACDDVAAACIRRFGR